MSDKPTTASDDAESGGAGRRFRLNSYFDDIRRGDQFVTGRRTVTEADIVNFSGLSGDYSAVHTDEVFAKDGPYGARIAHGCLTLSLATGLEFALMGNDQSRIIAFYGLDRVRFRAPVYIGDTIELHGEVIALDAKDESGGVVTVHQEIRNQHGETVASLDKRTLNRMRPR